MSTYSSGASTYTATATGWAPATQVLPQVLPVEEPKSHREQPAWKAGYRQLLTIASILAGVCLLLWVIWGFTSAAVPYVAKALLSWSAGITTVSAIFAVLIALAVRILGTHIDVATTRVVSSVRALQTLRGEMGAMHASITRDLRRCGGRLTELERRMEAQRDIAAWAAQFDRRLAQVQHAMRPAEETVPRQSNGAASPLDFSDDALRGYFRGFYDREPGGEEPTAGA